MPESPKYLLMKKNDEEGAKKALKRLRINDSEVEEDFKEMLEEKPDIMEYPTSKIRYGHYGQYTQKVLQEAKNMSEEEKEYLKKKMGNFMKKQFLLHNNNTVENNVIAEQLNELSQGELTIENPDDLTNTNQMLRSLGIQNQNRRSNNRKKQNKKKYKR